MGLVIVTASTGAKKFQIWNAWNILQKGDSSSVWNSLQIWNLKFFSNGIQKKFQIRFKFEISNFSIEKILSISNLKFFTKKNLRFQFWNEFEISFESHCYSQTVVLWYCKPRLRLGLQLYHSCEKMLHFDTCIENIYCQTYSDSVKPAVLEAFLSKFMKFEIKP